MFKKCKQKEQQQPLKQRKPYKVSNNDTYLFTKIA